MRGAVCPGAVQVKANMCKEPGTEEKDTSIFSAANLELIHVKNFRGTVRHGLGAGGGEDAWTHACQEASARRHVAGRACLSSCRAHAAPQEGS